MKSFLRIPLTVFLLATFLFGIVYPCFVTLTAQALWPGKANGEIIQKDGKTLGSPLIGQNFTQAKYFWGRPSVTPNHAYNAAQAKASHFGPSSSSLTKAVHTRITDLHSFDMGNKKPIPVDLVTGSGSGIDPHISVAAALYQLPRVARARNLPESTIKNLIEQATEKREFGFLGETGVNVLILNLKLDGQL